MDNLFEAMGEMIRKQNETLTKQAKKEKEQKPFAIVETELFKMNLCVN